MKFTCRGLSVCLLLYTLTVLGAAQTSMGTNTPPESLITSSGTGTETLPLNHTRVFVRFEQMSSSAVEAQTSVAGRASATIQLLLGAGIPMEDIRTESISIQPVYSFVNDTRTLQGYRSQYILSFDTTIDMTGVLIDQIVAAGGTIDRVVFQADPAQIDQARLAALNMAVDDAFSKATTVLDSLDLCTGPIRDIEVGYESLPPTSSSSSAIRFAAVTTPVLSGTGTVRATVTLKVAFTDAPCISPVTSTQQ